MRARARENDAKRPIVHAIQLQALDTTAGLTREVFVCGEVHVLAKAENTNIFVPLPLLLTFHLHADAIWERNKKEEKIILGPIFSSLVNGSYPIQLYSSTLKERYDF